jgi:hypothetical protein
MVIGWDHALAYTDLETARFDATCDALVDGGRGVVLKIADVALQSDTLSPEYLSPYEVVSQRLPLEARLGFSETAAGSLGGVLDGLLTVLKVAHDNVVNAISFGRGEKDAGVSDALEQLRRWSHGEKKEDWEGYGKQPKHKSKIPSLKGILNAAKKSKYVKGVKHTVNKINNVFNSLHKHMHTFKKKMSQHGKPKTGAKPNPTTKATVKIASQDIKVRVRINGKDTTTIVRKGSRYTLVKNGANVELHRRGGHGIVLVHPDDVSKLA